MEEARHGSRSRVALGGLRAGLDDVEEPPLDLAAGPALQTADQEGTYTQGPGVGDQSFTVRPGRDEPASGHLGALDRSGPLRMGKVIFRRAARAHR